MKHFNTDLIMMLRSARVMFNINNIANQVDGLDKNELTLTAGAALFIMGLRNDVDDYDIHVSQVEYNMIKRMNPELEVKTCSLGESLNGVCGDNKYTIFCLGDLKTLPFGVGKHDSIVKVLNFEQLKEQKWKLLLMWDRPMKKKIQDIKDLIAIRKGYKSWLSEMDMFQSGLSKR